MSDPQSPTPDTPTRHAFDEAVALKLRDCINDILLNHPEVHAVAASITWHGALNDASITHGVWLGGDGVVSSPAGIHAGIQQTMKMLGEQFGRAQQLAEHLQDQAQVLSTEALARHEENKTLEEAVKARRAELTELGGSA